MPPEHRQVVIVGAGPAGLAAALELRKRGIADVLVLEREGQAGGVPLWCHHTGFGLPDLRRPFSGPAYARHYAQRAEQAGIEVRTATTVTGWRGPRTLTTSSPAGLGEVEAGAVLLATGCREQPRSARLVPGSRPAGVFTTGALQRFVYQQHLPVGKRAVIVGAELVSLSALLTLRHAGLSCAMLATELPRHQVYMPYLPAKWLWADLLSRTPVRANVRVERIDGRGRVEGVELLQLDTGRSEHVACDTVVFTGDWRPENELARNGGLAQDAGTRGARVDAAFRASEPGVFAAGNLLRGAETASMCALEGRAAAASMARYLAGEAWPVAACAIEAQPPLTWVAPNVISPGAQLAGSKFGFQVAGFVGRCTLRVDQGARVLHRQRYFGLHPNTPLRLDGGWAARVDPAAGPVRLWLET